MSVFDRFLNTTGDSGAGFKLVERSNPLEWTRLGQSIAASLIGGFVIGLQMGVTAIFAQAAGLLEAAAGWLYTAPTYLRYPNGYAVGGESGLIVVVRDGLMGIMYAAWSPLTSLGWLAFPVAVAEVLAVLYMTTWAVSYAREEVI